MCCVTLFVQAANDVRRGITNSNHVLFVAGLLLAAAGGVYAQGMQGVKLDDG